MPTLSRFLGHSSQLLWKARPHRQLSKCVVTPQTRRTLATASDIPPRPRYRDSFSSRTSHLGISSNNIDIKIRGISYPASPVWLRDACPCSSCVDPSTRQKNFATVDIPEQITGRLTASDDASVTIEWTNDIPGSPAGHSTTFSHDTLLALLNPPSTDDEKPQARHARAARGLNRRTAWIDSEFRQQTADTAYRDYMENDDTLRSALSQLERYGLMFLVGVPEDESSIERVVERIGPLKNTFYGLTWDVRSVPEAKNVAYTSGDLGFHMDLMYLHQPPALQLLHCIRSSAKGGASRFTDIYAAALELLQTDREAFNVLAKASVGYHYDHPTQNYHTARRVIDLADARGQLEDIEEYIIAGLLRRHSTRFAWSPPFQAPFRRGNTHSVARSQSIDEWHAAARKLNHILHRPRNVHERMLGSGDLVIFDNRRTLHARTAFEVGDAGVERWLKGAYIDSDVWNSKYKTLNQQLDKQIPVNDERS